MYILACCWTGTPSCDQVCRSRETRPVRRSPRPRARRIAPASSRAPARSLAITPIIVPVGRPGLPRKWDTATAPQRDDARAPQAPNRPYPWKQPSKSPACTSGSARAGPGWHDVHRPARSGDRFRRPEWRGASPPPCGFILGLDRPTMAPAAVGGRAYSRAEAPAPDRRLNCSTQLPCSRAAPPATTCAGSPAPRSCPRNGVGRGDRPGPAWTRPAGAGPEVTRSACGSASAWPPRCSVTRRC